MHLKSLEMSRAMMSGRFVSRHSDVSVLFSILCCIQKIINSPAERGKKTRTEIKLSHSNGTQFFSFCFHFFFFSQWEHFKWLKFMRTKEYWRSVIECDRERQRQRQRKSKNSRSYQQFKMKSTFKKSAKHIKFSIADVYVAIANAIQNSVDGKQFRWTTPIRQNGIIHALLTFTTSAVTVAVQQFLLQCVCFKVAVCFDCARTIQFAILVVE